MPGGDAGTRCGGGKRRADKGESGARSAAHPGGTHGNSGCASSPPGGAEGDLRAGLAPAGPSAAQAKINRKYIYRKICRSPPAPPAAAGAAGSGEAALAACGRGAVEAALPALPAACLLSFSSPPLSFLCGVSGGGVRARRPRRGAGRRGGRFAPPFLWGRTRRTGSGRRAQPGKRRPAAGGRGGAGGSYNVATSRGRGLALIHSGSSGSRSQWEGADLTDIRGCSQWEEGAGSPRGPVGGRPGRIPPAHAAARPRPWPRPPRALAPRLGAIHNPGAQQRGPGAAAGARPGPGRAAPRAPGGERGCSRAGRRRGRVWGAGPGAAEG